MNAARIAELRGLISSGGIAFHPPTPAEIGELLDAVEKRLEPHPHKSFTSWLMQLEQLSGRAYSEKAIAWLRINGYRKELTPAAALDAHERAFGI